MSRYIVSGCSGQVGRLLVQKIGEYVAYKSDVDVNKNDVFIHLAAKSQGEYREIIESNIHYLSEVIEFCKEKKIQRLIFFSAAGIYNHQNLYTASKLFAEEMLKASTLKVLVLRLPMILTNEDSMGVFNTIVKKLIDNEDVFLHNGEKFFNNFVSIDDISEFIKQYAFKKKYECLNLASRKDTTLLELVQYLKAELQSTSTISTDVNEEDVFDLSIDRAVDEYNYRPSSNKEKLSKWLKMRMK